MSKLRWMGMISAVVAVLFCMASVGSAQHKKLMPKVDNFIFLYDASGSMLSKYMDTGKYNSPAKRKVALAIRTMVIMTMDIPELGYNAGLYKVAPEFEAYKEMGPYNSSALIKAIKGLPAPTGPEVKTPLAEGMKNLDGVLSTLTGSTAVILVSDGAENRGGSPAAVAKDLYSKHDVCFHVISFAETASEKAVVDNIASLNSCSTTISGKKALSRPALEDFTKQIFYELVTVEEKGASDSDGDGVVDSRDKCPGTPEGVEVDDKGCALDTDGDGVADYKDKCRNTPNGASVNDRGCWVVEDLQFETNKAEILPANYESMIETVEILRRNPGIDVELQGYTDSRGSEKYNQALSERRAKAVRDFLVKRGIDPDRLSYKGYGETDPVASNATAQGRAKNRRVEIRPLY